ncbi:MAG: 3-oxoadipate enol-lactonase [Myxococcota bacterium]|jgi:3-oxoadipate enol-lactonase
MPTAAIDGIQLNYEVHGTGEPVLMIMGLAVGLVGWRLQVEDLAGDEFQLCVFDNRGVGKSTAPRPPYSMARLAADALDLMDHLGWQRAHVVGVSMGGMIAQHVALTAADRVRSLTLIATHAGGWGGRPTRTAVGGVISAHLSGSARLRRRALIAMLHSKQHLEEVGQEAIEARLKETILHNPPPRFGMLGQVSAVLRHRTHHRLSELASLPALVITGTADAMVRPANSITIAAAIEAELLQFEGGGHAIHVEQREAVSAALRRHFKGALALAV